MDTDLPPNPAFTIKGTLVHTSRDYTVAKFNPSSDASPPGQL